MRTARIVLILAVAVLIASPVWAQKKAAAKKPAPCPADQRICKLVEGLELTADQKTKLDALKKEFGPKLVAAMKTGDVLTADQKKARREAEQKAKADGKTGKDLLKAVAEAVTLTEDQKAKQAESRKAVGALAKDLEKAAMAVLTDEQKATLKKKADEARKKAKEAKKAK